MSERASKGGGVATSLSAAVGSLEYQQAGGPVASGGTGFMSPGEPVAPTHPQAPRAIDFPVGTNLNYTPRAGEPFGFSALKAFGNTELVRLCIETRKDQIERLDWRIKTREGRKKRARHDADVRAAEKFFRKPDGVTPFATWLRAALEDLLVLDAPAIEKRRNYGGGLIGLDVLPGDTFKLLVDQTGRTPLPPAPAYQQVIKGNVWANMSTLDLIYAPRNKRAGKVYGFSPVEQIIVTVNVAIQRQMAQLAYFTEGNLPQGMATVPEGWDAKQIGEFQTWFNALLSGNAAERAKLIWGPHGAKFEPFKAAPIKDEFDEWLARIVCFAFSLSPTPFIRQLNRSTAETSDNAALEEGREPLMLWWKRIADEVIADELGFADLEWSWITPEEIDPVKKSEANERYVKTGILRVNEVRDELGQEPVPGGDKNYVYTAKGPVELGAKPEPKEGDGGEGEPTEPADEEVDA